MVCPLLEFSRRAEPMRNRRISSTPKWWNTLTLLAQLRIALTTGPVCRYSPSSGGNRMRLKCLPLSMLFFFACAMNVYSAEFYQGKTIRVIVGGSAGGGFDIYTRAMARHMGKHIPGNPTLVVENMTGAGTRIAAKYLY